MRKTIITTITALLVSTVLMTACVNTQNADTDPATADSVITTVVADGDFDPYSVANRYDVGAEMFEKRSDVDYGTLLKDVTYYSTIAADNKQVNILLPAGYDENQTYPVTYVFHGFGGDHNTHIDTDSYLVLLYGNMLHDSLAVPQILVGMDMYTDKLVDKESKSEEELRYIYDKAIKETGVDLMPFIEENYPVKTGRENTAIAGMSEGGAKSLCTGFEWLEKFSYIGAFAPDTGVIPTEYYKGTFWNTPYMEEFPQPTEDNAPYYLYMTVGSEDPWNIDCTLYYRDVLNEMGVKNQTELVEGYGHDSDFWGQCFYNYLSKIFRQLQEVITMMKTAELVLTQEWDKTFPKSDKVDHSKVTFINRYGITLAADMYVPQDAKGKLPAIAVSGPFGAVKEQSSGLYAQAMAERGFLTIAFDPSFTGESGGEPRYMASPDINTEDFMAAVDFLSLNDKVDPDRIGIIGICGWGGMAINAAALDTPIKATVASTMYDMTRVAAKGYFDSEDSEEARYNAKKAFNAQRIEDYKNGFYKRAGGVVDPLPEDAPFFVKDYYDYYKTARGYHPRSLNSNDGWNAVGTMSFLNQPILQYSNEIRSAVLMIHGDKAHSCYMSRDAYADMVRDSKYADNKELYIIDGASHTDLYDGGGKNAIPFDKLEAFFTAYLK